jgi:hypothetical protein
LGSTSSTGAYPAKVMQTNWYIQNTLGNAAAIKFTGLNDDKRYTFIFFASRLDNSGTIDRTTDYTINNITASLNASNNTDRTAKLENTASSGGQLILYVDWANPTGFGYISCLEILESEPTQMASVEAARVAADPEPELMEFSAYPIPFHMKLNVVVPETLTGNVQIKILDKNGRIWRSKTGFGDRTYELETPDLPKGMYYIKVTSESGYQKVQRAIKE